MIQDSIKEYLHKVDTILGDGRLVFHDHGVDFPKSEGRDEMSGNLRFVRAAYYMLLEAYAKNMLENPRYECKDAIETFLSSTIDVSPEAMLEFLKSINTNRSALFSCYYGFFPNTHWSFGDLAGLVTSSLTINVNISKMKTKFKNYLNGSKSSYLSALDDPDLNIIAQSVDPNFTDIWSCTDVKVLEKIFDILKTKKTPVAAIFMQRRHGAPKCAVQDYGNFLVTIGKISSSTTKIFHSTSNPLPMHPKKSTSIPPLPQTIIDEFVDFLVKMGIIKPGSKASYRSYIRAVDKQNKHATMSWIDAAIKTADPITFLKNEFRKVVSPSATSYRKWENALCLFGEFIMSHFMGSMSLITIPKFDIFACQLVASTAIFCDKTIADEVKNGKLGSKKNNIGKGNSYFSWFNCSVRRLTANDRKLGYKVGGAVGGIELDDNSKANQAIKRAVIEGLNRKFGISIRVDHFKDFEACHIWERTCYDEKYHTSVTNLVLIPRSIAGLSDHCAAVIELLRYEAWNRFGFKPNGQPIPTKPSFYNKIIWR